LPFNVSPAVFRFSIIRPQPLQNTGLRKPPSWDETINLSDKGHKGLIFNFVSVNFYAKKSEPRKIYGRLQPWAPLAISVRTCNEG
jgi:hypothetical protein